MFDTESSFEVLLEIIPMAFFAFLPIIFLLFIIGLIIHTIAWLDYKWFGRISLSTQDPWMLKPRMQIIREYFRKRKKDNDHN